MSLSELYSCVRRVCSANYHDCSKALDSSFETVLYIQSRTYACVLGMLEYCVRCIWIASTTKHTHDPIGSSSFRTVDARKYDMLKEKTVEFHRFASAAIDDDGDYAMGFTSIYCSNACVCTFYTIGEGYRSMTSRSCCCGCGSLFAAILSRIILSLYFVLLSCSFEHCSFQSDWKPHHRRTRGHFKPHSHW